VIVEQGALDDERVQYFEDDGRQAVRGYVAPRGGLAQQLVQRLEAGPKHLCLEPGE